MPGNKFTDRLRRARKSDVDPEALHECKGCTKCKRSALTVGEQVKAARLLAGYTQAQLAKKIEGVGSHTIKRIEGDKSDAGNKKSLIKIARVLGIAIVIGDDNEYMNANFDIGVKLMQDGDRVIIEHADHGTSAGYRKFKCRCDKCREWNAARLRRYYKKKGRKSR